MKRFHHLLRLWFTTAALTVAILEAQLPLLATEATVPPPDSPPNAAQPEASPSPVAAAPEAIALPEASAPEAIAAPEAPAVPTSASPVPTPAASSAAPAAQPPARQTIRLESARQKIEERLAAIVARDQAAKTAQLQQHLVETALEYAEAGDLVQARLIAQHPVLPLEIQTDTLAKIDAIAMHAEGNTLAQIIAAATPNANQSATPPTAARPVVRSPQVASRWMPPVQSPQFRPAIAIGGRCVPQQANLLSVSAPTTTVEAVASRPIKSERVSLKPLTPKAPAVATVSLPESIEVRQPQLQPPSAPPAAATVAIAKLSRLAVSIPTVSAKLPESSAAPLRLNGFAIEIVKATKQTASTSATASLPSLPIVYVDAKIDRSRTPQPASQAASVPAVAMDCGGTGLTVAYTGRSSLSQRLSALGFAFPLPIPAALTSAFGWRIHPISGDRRFHAGIDLGAPMGTPVLAAMGGQVVTAGDQGGYGLAVIIENQNHRNLYGHLSNIAVQPGQTVSAGSVIGWVGSTGNSTGPHLHFETLYLTEQGWQVVDPLGSGAIARGY